jgi:hypothetical protein
MTTEEKLDELLNYYREKQYKPHSMYDPQNKKWGDLAIRTCGENNIEFLQLTQKVTGDKYVEQINSDYYITPEGNIFIGYQETNRRKRISSNLQLVQTWAIAIGTLGLLVFEVIKAICHLH